MPRATRSKAPATKPEPAIEAAETKVPKTKATETKAPNSKGNNSVKEHRQKRQALRQKRYQAAKMSQRKKVFQDAIKSAGTAKEKAALRAAVFQRPMPKSKGTEKLADLEALVKKQEEETREQKKKQKAQKAAKAEAEKPAKKAAGKVKKSPAKPKVKAVKKGTAAPEEVVATTEGEPMQGVEETKVVESVEKDPDHHVIPSIEEIKETIEEDTAPASPPKTEGKQADTSATLQLPRESSAESHAGTPRTLRRSPRKRTKRSLDGI